MTKFKNLSPLRTLHKLSISISMVLTLVFMSQISSAQIYLNEFTGTTACPTQGNVPTMAANATGTPLTRSTITCTTASGVFNSNTLNNTATINTASYIEFTVTADPGYLLNLTSVSFFRQGSNTAPNQLEVSYSTDNFTTSTSWGSAPLTTNPGSVATWDFPDFSTAPNGTVAFRIYPYGTQRCDLAAGTASATGTLRLDNVTINGTVLPTSPAIFTDLSTVSFGTLNVGSQSSSQVVQVSGINLTGAPDNITASVTGFDFELSNDNSSWGPSATIAYSASTLGNTPLYVRFTPLAAGSLTDVISFTGGGTSSAPTVSLDGTGSAVAAPTQLVITSVVPSSPVINTGFDVTVVAQGPSNNIQNVIANTDVVLNVSTGTGILTGTVAGTMTAGTNTITFTNISYNVAETGVVLSADRISGDVLSSGLSDPFDVLGIATQLSLTGVPSTGLVATNLNSFTVEALRADNTLDINYTGPITISLASGPGALSGTTTVNAVAGVATFNDLQLSQNGLVTLTASASGLTSATTSTITILLPPSVTDLILPQYAINGGTTGQRLQYICRLQLENLLPNSTYRYFTGGSTLNNITTATAAGNFYAINNTANSFGNIVGQSSSKTFNGSLMDGDEFVTTGRYAELTTDANGMYAGWFAMTPSGNAVFADGNQIYFYVQLNDGNGGTSIDQSLRSNSTITMIAANTSARAVAGNSNATAENPIFLYDNVAGSGRPIYGTWAENDGITTNYSTWYSTSSEGIAGAWGAYVPTNLPNGIQRIEQRSIADASIVGCTPTDADGIWTVAGSTVNPTSGVSPIMFDITDAPLDGLPIGGTASGPVTGNTGSVASYSLSGESGNIQWQESTTSATGPFTDISGETMNTLNYTAASAGTYYFRARLTSTSAYCEDFSNVVTTVISTGNATLDLTCFIQGYYAGSSTMQSVLLNQGVSGALATETDDITVDLMDGTTLSQNYTFTGKLLTDGTISCTFPAAAIGNSHYIRVTNRNMVETWSANPITFAANNSYNFSSSASQAYGSNQIDAAVDGVYSMYNGDVTQDGTVDIFDFLAWDADNQAFAAGYYATDFNGDGNVDIFDFLIWDPNNQNFIGLVTP